MIFLMIICCWLVGKLLCNHFHGIIKKMNPILLGFILILSFFQFFSIPFLYYHVCFDKLYYSFLTLLIGTCFASACLIFRQDKLFKHSLLCKRFSFCFCISTILIIVQMLVYAFLWHSDADDSFYIAQITTILDSNQLLTFDPSTGDANFLFQAHYELVGYEVLLAIICRLFAVNPAFFCHTILPIFLILIYYILMYSICNKISKQYQDAAFLIIILINMFSGYSVYSRGAFLLFRLWQGKAVLVNITLPLLLFAFLEVFERKKVDYNNIIFFIIILYLGFCSTTIGIYIVPFMYGVYTITFFLYTLNIKQTLKLGIPIVFSLPYVLLKYIVLRENTVIGFITSDADTLSYLDMIKNINGSGFMLIAWGIALSVIFVYGDRLNRYFYVMYAIICFLTVLNPLFCGFIAKNITGTSVYWRLFWLFQFTFTFVIAFKYIYEKQNKKIFVWLGVFAILLVCGKPIFSKGNYVVAQNKEKISNTTKSIVNSINNSADIHPRVLMPLEYAVEARQYSGNIVLVWSRYSRMEYRLNGEEDMYEELLAFYENLYAKRDFGAIDTIIQKYDVDYIVLYNDETVQALNPNYEKRYENSEVIVYQTNMEGEER